MLLSLCIPTFNRSADLSEALEVINHELNAFSDEDLSKIELTVVDNFSTDETEFICKNFLEKCKCTFSYEKNPKNIGFDGSIIRLYSLAKGTYVWFLSDDDRILDGGLRTIFNILRAHQPDLCHANIQMPNELGVATFGRTTNLTHFLRGDCFVRLEFDRLIYFSSNLERLSYIRMCSFISSCIIRRNPSVIPGLSEYLGTGIMQDAIMNSLLELGSTVYIPSMPIVSSGTKNYVSEWFMHSVLFGTQKLYCSKNLKIRDKLNKIISIDSCRFGLMVLADRASIDLRYKVSGALFFKILAIYRFDVIFMIKEILFAYFPSCCKFFKKLFSK